MRVCIYTAIYGNYDPLKAQPAQNVPTDFVCFTESRRLGPTRPWTIVYNNRLPGLHPRLRAKYFKILSHRIFPNGRPSPAEGFAFCLRRHFRRYDYLIWIDGSGQIKSSDFAARTVSQIGPSGWAMFSHPERNCIYDEMQVSATMPKYQKLPMAAQIDSYRAEGYPAANGLEACGVIVRAARRKDLSEINEMWWLEQLRWTYQDQLSLPVVLHRLGRGCDTLEGDLWRNDLIGWAPHENID